MKEFVICLVTQLSDVSATVGKIVCKDLNDQVNMLIIYVDNKLLDN